MQGKMVASKVSNTAIQHDLSDAQQWKCENRCVNGFKLQSELHEVRLELKSVKEIINISTETWPRTMCMDITYMNRNISYCYTNI
jgi:hypothetical protein